MNTLIQRYLGKPFTYFVLIPIITLALSLACSLSGGNPGNGSIPQRRVTCEVEIYTLGGEQPKQCYWACRDDRGYLKSYEEISCSE